MIYISDRGDEYEITTMEISHLVNVIGHHQTQLHTLQILHDSGYPHPSLQKRQKMIHQVTTILAHELMQRDVDIIEYLPDFDALTLQERKE